MPITGLSFLLFALAAVVLYYLFPKRLRQYVLLAASILFYLTYGVRMAGYLAATILPNPSTQRGKQSWARNRPGEEAFGKGALFRCSPDARAGRTR